MPEASGVTSMRVVLITIALILVTAFCGFFLILTGVMGSRPEALIAGFLGLFMWAVLFAAISAIGPKFRPTPFLTPTFAGSIAALLATIAILLLHNEIPRREAPAVATIRAEPPKTAERVVKPPEKPVLPMLSDPFNAPELPDAIDMPLSDEKAFDAPPPPEGPLTLPAPRPPHRPDRGGLTLAAPGATPPEQPETVAERAVSPTRLIPPRPRIRPCGGDGPPCP